MQDTTISRPREKSNLRSRVKETNQTKGQEKPFRPGSKAISEQGSKAIFQTGFKRNTSDRVQKKYIRPGSRVKEYIEENGLSEQHNKVFPAQQASGASGFCPGSGRRSLLCRQYGHRRVSGPNRSDSRCDDGCGRNGCRGGRKACHLPYRDRDERGHKGPQGQVVIQVRQLVRMGRVRLGYGRSEGTSDRVRETCDHQ